MTVKLTKDEIRDLKAYGYGTNDIREPSVGQEIDGIILISRGRGTLHDSGYPFIQVLGYLRKDASILYDLCGCHDHIWFSSILTSDIKTSDINIDSLGKNLIRMWRHGPFVLSFGKPNTSTMQIHNDNTIW